MINRLKLWVLNKEAEKYKSRIFEYLPVKENFHVADIGSGGGAFTLAMSEKAGLNGKIYAVDVNAKNLFYLGRKAKKAGLVDRIVLTLADEDDCVLPESACDLVFSRNSFHHINNPGEYFVKVARALKPSGILAVIDYDGTRGLPKYLSHYTPPLKIKNILEKTGFVHNKSFDILPGQSYQLFSKAG